MLPIARLFPAIVACLLFCASALAQTPRVYLKFDGNLSDSSGAGVITSVTPSSGWTPTYTTDRNGAANSALVISGSQSLQLIASSLVGNSNQALGLRNSSGTNTSFTLVAWIYCTNVSGGYNTVFGNTLTNSAVTTEAGTLHAGLGSATDKTHFGFNNSNDITGATAAISGSVWYHVAFVYDTAALTSGSGTAPSQRIYVNGVPEVTRWGVTDTLRAADLLIGNWGTATDSTNDFRGRLDDVAVYNVALKADQIQALYNGVSPNSLPAAGTYSGPKMPGLFGTPGNWGVREIKAYSGISYGTLVNADRIVRAYATTPSGTVAEYQTPVINFSDDEGPGNLGYFPNEGDFGTNTASADDNFLMIARCTVRIPAGQGGDYTFGFRGDDGSRLRVLGKQFSSSTRIGGGNVADPAQNGDGISFPNGTGDSNTIGVVNLVPGDYNLELVWWEGTGGSSVEVFAAKGAKTSVDSAFQLIGNTAAGGLELVRDPDTIPTFTVNGGSTLFVHSGSPSSFTLAWSVANSTTALSINQGIGTVAQSGSQSISSPAATKTYTITATTPVAGGGTDVSTKSVTVYVNSAPVISSFAANDATVTAGTPVTLSWTVDGATSLMLQPGNINVTGQTSVVVNPAVDTTYILQATNPSGTSQQSVFISIGTAPTITSFTTTDANPLYGAETSLVWNTTGATSLSINQGVGTISGATGSIGVAPLVTTTYILTATNTYGTSTASVAINQPTPIGVSSAGFTVTRYNASTAIPFTGMGYLQSADALIAGTNLSGTPTTVTGVTSINYSDGIDGDFTTGNAAFPGGTGNGVNFAVRVTGTLIVNTPGEYSFLINSDDGARLRVDGQDLITDDSTHSPTANSGKITITKPTVPIEIVYYNAPTNGGSSGAELEFAWIRPNLAWSLIGTVSPTAPTVRGKVIISEFVANNSSLLDEDGSTPDWIEIWNSTNSTVNLSGYYLTDDALVPNKWALPAWTLAPNAFAIVFASNKDRAPAQAVAGQDNPGTLAQPHMHTNFKLAKTGGYLALNQSNGSGGYVSLTEGVTVFSAYPPQSQDVSYGSSDAEGYIGYMETATPGQPNAATVIDFVKDTAFTDASTGLPRKRGRNTSPFNLVISTATPGATIRYTTDGSTPTLNYGNIYTGPIAINGTSVIRAAAFKAGWKPTNVDTETYLFIDDIVNQTTATAVAQGFPSGSVNGQIFRYGLTLANVTSAGGTLQNLKDALAAAPSVCMTTDIGNLVNASTGIYVNPSQHGLEWERPISLEYINAAGTSEFQIGCGARIRGGFSRSTSNPKHAFHLYFRGSLYGGDLKYRLFGTSGASRFSQIDMRCEENNSWSFQSSTQNSLMREEWSRVSQGDMGMPSAHTGYFHLYINGIYWGVYNWEERTEASYGETYLGGNKEDYDCPKSAGSSGSYNTEMTDGNFIAWKSLNDQCIALKNDTTSEASRTAKYMNLRGLDASGNPNGAQVLLDVDNLIDYILLVFYDGSFDSPLSTFLSNGSNNWFALRSRLGTRGFAYFAHDQEHGMDSGTQSYNRIGPWGGTGPNNWSQTEYGTRESLVKSNPQYLHELLCYSAEYRQRFADRVQKHFFNNGALTTTAALNRANALAAQVDPIIHAEAARWGSSTLNRNAWLNTAKASILSFINTGGTPQSGQYTFTNPFTGGRTALVVEQLRGYQDPLGTAKALYPAATLSAPTYSGQFGGAVANPYSFQISNPNAAGTIYYTTNGTDPRAIGGGVTPGALTGTSPISLNLTTTTTVRARIYNGTDWSPLVDADYLVGALASASNLVISKIHYNPPGSANTTQFVELMNISNQTIDLTNVQFTIGIQFQFPDFYTLAPGARVLIVRDLTAFQAAYPAVSANQIAGVFANGTTLATNGEQLVLIDSTGANIRNFSYDNKSPWPQAPDGGGPSLVLMRPTTNPDHSIATNWRASYSSTGAPGADDSFSYTAWASTNGVGAANLDDDGDGLSNLAEYYLGSNPASSLSSTPPILGTQAVDVGGVVSNYLTITIRHTLGRDNASLTAEAASDLLGTWGAAVLVGTPTYNGDGTETLVYRHPSPIPAPGSAVKQFLRARMTLLP